eukprot:2113089-Pyramimonas_sp.AAC.1
MEGLGGASLREREEVAEAFATFFENLYASTRQGCREHVYGRQSGNLIPPFARGELAAATRDVQNGKTADDQGVRAEFSKLNIVDHARNYPWNFQPAAEPRC